MSAAAVIAVAVATLVFVPSFTANYWINVEMELIMASQTNCFKGNHQINLNFDTNHHCIAGKVPDSYLHFIQTSK